jgi:hypothetical protein
MTAGTMSYGAASQLMQTGDLLATDTPGLIQRGIKLVTKGDVSHVCGIVVVAGRRMVLETTLGTGVHLVALSRWISERSKGGIYWWPARFSEKEQRKYQAALFSLLGAKYEAPLAMLTRVAMGRKVKDNDRWFCSEIEALARGEARPAQFKTMWPEPSEVWPVHVSQAYGGLRTAFRVTL